MKEKKEKPKTPKICFKGVFNYAHSIHILYCYSVSERGAWRNFCKRLADKHLVDVGVVMNMFGGEKDNYSIAIEKSKGGANGKLHVL